MTDPSPTTPPQYPVVLDLRSRLVVVIGPGAVAERRARTFVRYGADVAVITPDPTLGLVESEAEGRVTMERRPYVRGDLEGAFLVFCQSGSAEVDAAVVAEAEERGCLVRVPDTPQRSNFSVPSVIRRGALQLAISTGGMAPRVAKQIKGQLEEEFGDEYRRYLELYAEVRQLAADRLAEDPEAQRMLLDAFVDSTALERLRTGEALDAEQIYDELAPGESEPETGGES